MSCQEIYAIVALSVIALSQYILWRIRQTRALVATSRRQIAASRADIAQTRLDIARRPWGMTPESCRRSILWFLNNQPAARDVPTWHIHDARGKQVATLMSTEVLQHLLFLIPVSEEATSVLMNHEHLEAE